MTKLKIGLVALAVGTVAQPVLAQPFGGWPVFSRAGSGYVEVNHDSDLNPTGAFTFEAWVAVTDAGGCSNIAGKGYTSAWWIGVCGTTLRSYLSGGGSSRNGGTIPAGEWTHIAVTSDGTTRRHYIDGELAATFAGAGALTTNSDDVRFGSDEDYASFEPNGSLNEVRLWNVERSVAQIRSAINTEITAPQAGLVGVWSGPSLAKVVGDHNSSVVNTLPGSTFPVAFSCFSSPNAPCLQDDRFAVSVDWQIAPGNTGAATTVLEAADSALMQFFNPDNWELVVKVLNGCGSNNRYWVYAAAATTLHYRITVLDVQNGQQKIYFNYNGVPASALTDVSAFDTCP